MTLKELKLKKAYDSDRDNLLRDFYIPALSESVKYKRLAGFFSSSALAKAAKGMAKFIQNGGKFELVVGVQVNEDDYEAIKKSMRDPKEVAKAIMLEQLKNLDVLENYLKNHVEALAWMLANELLEIKVAIVPPNNLFHMKVGILEDGEGNSLSFSGSENETASGWEHNIEEFKVFRSWESSEDEYFRKDEEKFNRFWNNNSKRAYVISIPEAVKSRILQIKPKSKDYIVKQFEKLEQEQGQEQAQKEAVKKEEVRKVIKLRDYQKEAIQNWIKNDYKGIFEMATGTGKTLTALGCLDKILEKGEKILCVISAPYSHLLEQWKKEIKSVIEGAKGGNFNNLSTLLEGEQILIGSAHSNWKRDLSNKLADLETGLLDRLIILTTHDSLGNQLLINKIPNINVKKMLIADEVHAVGTPGRTPGLLNTYDMRLGLSATPKRWMDEEGSKFIFDYFHDTVYEFSLEKAIKTINPETGKTYLTPYVYLPYFTELTAEEEDKYIEISKKIGQLSTYSDRNESYRERLDHLNEQRADILKLASNKIGVLEEILKEIRDKHGDIRYTLIYCHRGEQLEEIQVLLNNLGIKQHEFTGEEGTRPEARFNSKSEREAILNEFASGYYQALVAMKCLDEGVDVPPARIGVLVASSINPREFIQRRGRILRRYEGKEKAFVYDIIILPPAVIPDSNEEFQKHYKGIIKKEFARYREFSQIADNSSECLIKLIDIEKKLNIYTT